MLTASHQSKVHIETLVCQYNTQYKTQHIPYSLYIANIFPPHVQLV